MAKMAADGLSDHLIWKMQSPMIQKPIISVYHAVTASVSFTETATWLIVRANVCTWMSVKQTGLTRLRLGGHTVDMGVFQLNSL